MSSSEVPNTNLGKLNLFLSKLSDFSGQDVFSMFASHELSVYKSRFGGELKYVETAVEEWQFFTIRSVMEGDLRILICLADGGWTTVVLNGAEREVTLLNTQRR